MGLGMVIVTSPEQAETVKAMVPEILEVGSVIPQEDGSRVELRGRRS